MLKTLFSLGIILSSIGLPIHLSHAAQSDSNTEVLMEQLSAISSYLTRMHGVGAAKPLTAIELRTSIKSGVAWLKNAQEGNGHFRYEYVPYEGIYRNDDNIVRQTGTLYILGEITRRDKKDSYKITKTILSAINYLTSLTKSDTSEDVDFRCIANTVTSTKCQLGATSLALIGILDYLESSPKDISAYKNIVDSYLSFILTMQKENGGFRDTYTIGGTKQNEKESSFSNGEALLALARYYRFENNTHVKESINRAFAYLATQPYDANVYLWIMAAQKDLYSFWQNEYYRTYTKAFTEWRVNEAASLKNSNRNYCAYAEGLASALSILEGTTTDTVHDSFRNELNRLNRKHFALQLSEADHYRLLPREGTLELRTFTDASHAIGGFLTSDAEPTQRIDFTQHCLGAYTQTLFDLEKESL